MKSLSHVRLLATPWAAAYQTPPSMDFPGKSTGVGCRCLLQWKHQQAPFLHSLTCQCLPHTPLPSTPRGSRGMHHFPMLLQQHNSMLPIPSSPAATAAVWIRTKASRHVQPKQGTPLECVLWLQRGISFLGSTGVKQ